MKKILALMIGLTFYFSSVIVCSALTVELSGTHYSGNGILGSGEWTSGVEFTWNAVDNRDGTWTYTYGWTAPNRDLSHLNIEVSDNFSSELTVSDNPDLVSWSVNPSDGESYDIGFFDGNPWKAFKFDNLTDSQNFTLILTTNRMPMDGHFYAEDGDGTYAYSTEYIAVPNSVVPIPSAVWLLGYGLIGVVGMKRKLGK
jgi:hypothetical protein